MYVIILFGICRLTECLTYLYISPIATPGLLFIFNDDEILYIDLTEDGLTSFPSFLDNIRTLVNVEDSGAHILGIKRVLYVYIYVSRCVI